MPVNRIVATKRGKTAVAAAVALALVSGWTAFTATQAKMTPAAVRAAIDRGITPPAVTLAVNSLIKPWEGLRTTAYRDIAGIWTICYGETEGVRPGMTRTPAQCEAMLSRRLTRDYFLPLVDGVQDFVLAPDSVQAALTSGAYNFGVGATIRSSAARHVAAHRYRQACEAQTAFNKARVGGKLVVVNGLVKRREMGDAQRLGEAETCVSGLD